MLFHKNSLRVKSQEYGQHWSLYQNNPYMHTFKLEYYSNKKFGILNSY